MEVKAMHIARRIDTVSLFQKLYSDRARVQHILQKDSVVLCLKGYRSSSNFDNLSVPASEAKHLHHDRATDMESIRALENFYTTPRSSWGMDFSKQPPKLAEYIAPHAVGAGIGLSDHSSPPLTPTPLNSFQEHANAQEEQQERERRRRRRESDKEDHEEGPEIVELPPIQHRDRFVVYYEYGACVFFNCDDKLVSAMKRHLRPFLHEVSSDARERAGNCLLKF